MHLVDEQTNSLSLTVLDSHVLEQRAGEYREILSEMISNFFDHKVHIVTSYLLCKYKNAYVPVVDIALDMGRRSFVRLIDSLIVHQKHIPADMRTQFIVAIGAAQGDKGGILITPLSIVPLTDAEYESIDSTEKILLELDYEVTSEFKQKQEVIVY